MDFVKPESKGGMNAALFRNTSDEDFASWSLAPWLEAPGCYLVSDDPGTLPSIDAAHRLPYPGSLPETPETSSETILAELNAQVKRLGDVACLIVDMRWALNTVWGPSTVERWGGMAQRIAETYEIAVVSLYDRETLVEDQMAAAFRVHQTFLSPSGCYDNPHWLPEALVHGATLDQQLSFFLGRIVPEFAEETFHRTQLPDAARGATPAWVRQPRHSVATDPAQSRWHIHCLGPLKVFVAGNMPVKWAIPGSAPNKSRALFAYLLNRGEGGAHADQLAELLWPEDGSENSKRARLRHAIAMLRKSLGGSATVLRTGETYRLNVPQGSWIDIRAFEQLCRRGLALFRYQDYDRAIRVYEAAERLYAGDLFGDLALDYIQSEFDDWCLPKRVWLRDMAVKLQYDMSKVLRQQGRLREALEHCQTSLRLDPLNDSANIEIMRVLAGQKRVEAIHRHYSQYVQAIGELQGEEPSEDVRSAYRELAPKTGKQGSQTKTKPLRLV
ncbi:hypothetical protein AS156_18510 [Bradyrhizobium macuxiense]|uniref:Bacterial transcriptional activator domain-containing protein n=1 Tax=Bradyrhizobium macuxiense TaxID=1755647 RepID=A0A109JGG6_9BRAD|nr:BTAD domain-containing putative transcriptional regulator [Bradyrhizobium macuxiense]KWV48468.1 hypothetical protein AS156_18510 [Bradyrhizobium macuxiense]